MIVDSSVNLQIEPYLNRGTTIIADNAGDYGDLMRDYLTYVSTDPKYRSTFLNIDKD